ncbi:MAG: hypothetical protein M1372_02100 [Patescibacteria group bacterium]|nr:hypothetical protein [Patescibacteria group bacterium]
MPEAEGEAGVGAPITHDATRRVEIRDSRETVINAFNSAYSIFESYPEDKLTPQQQATRELIKHIRGETLDKGKASYLNRFESEDGEKFSQREYVPVDELILFLRDRVKSGELTAEDETEYKELEKILHRNSQEYYRGAAKKDYSRKIARINQESQRISSDPRLTKGNPHDDFLEAGRILFGRRELITPPSSTQPSPPSPEPESAPTSEATEITPAQPPTDGTSTAPSETTPEPESEEVAEPEPESPEQVRREVMIINRTLDVQKRARELADEQLRNEMRRGSFLNPLNWPRKIGLRVMEEFHRQRYIERASREMLANNNSYLSMDVVRNAAVDATHRLSEERQAGQAKIEQLRTGTLIEGQQTVEAQGELRTTIINDIIRPVVEGGIADQAQIQQRLREFVENHQDDPQVQAVFGRDANQFGRLAEYFATDLLETGEAIKGDLEAHRYSLDELDSLIQVRLANTSWAAETQVRLNAVDRAIAWAERHRLTGTLINPATIGAGFSIGTFGLMRGLGFGARASQFIVPGAGLLPGALFAAARRNYDLKIDRASHQVERAYNMRIPQGARRREALEQLSYNTASVDQMINGGGQELLTGTDRQSLEELLSQDLSEGQTSNREAVARRITEIQSRLDFSSRERVDLVTYQSREQVEQGRLVLINSVARSIQALRNSGMSNEEIQELETRFTGQWNSRFTQNREQQDRAFARYRLRQAAGAAVFGGTVGLGAGFLVQEGIALGERAAGLSAGQTVIEKGIHKVTGLFGQHEQGGPPNIDHFKDLYAHGGSAELGNHMQAVINPADHSVSIVDEATHQAIASGSIGPDGVLHNIVAGDGLSRDAAEQLRNGFSASGFASSIHETTARSPSMLSSVQETISKHELTKSFHQKGLDIEVNGVTNHVTIHDTLANATLEGHVSPDGTLTFDQIGNPNVDFAALHRDLAAAGFNVTEAHQAGSVTAVDHLLSSSPSELQKQGIIETDMVRKSWNFHVLRPDIVAQTGEHTHNELTLHIGQYLDENGRWVTDQKGILNFGGDIKGDLIPSNLPGVAPMHDQVLDQLITANGPIHHNDMVFVVDLNDGRQIMLGADNLGNARLPQELFNPQTGEIQGVRSIASAILEKDGNLLRSGSVLQEGTIPGGTTVHSLASVALETSSPQPIPSEIINAIPPSESMITHHFAIDIIPPLHETFEAPPIIPIPFAPRHPLEALIPPELIYPYYPEGIFPKGSRIRDVLRTSSSGEILTDQQEGKKALKEIREALDRCDEIYVILGGAIGDAVIATAYLQAIKKAIEGRNIKINVIINKDHQELFKGFETEKIKLIPALRGYGFQNASAQALTSSARNPLIIDFEHYRAENPVVTSQEDGTKKRITFISNLFSPAIELYNNNSDGQAKYARFIEDLFSLSEGTIMPQDAKTTIALPPNETSIYGSLTSRYSINPSSPQIGIVIESKIPGKRYSLSNWAETIKIMATRDPNYQFNLLYNGGPQDPSYTKEEIENALRGVGVLDRVNIISSTLVEAAVLLSHQNVVLSNDTGLAHVAVAIEGGPNVATIYMPRNFPPSMWASSPKQKQITLTQEEEERLPTVDVMETDESKKLINRIAPERIAEMAFELLASSP